ncbi:MAG: esterase-like activity of phytase family protein [Sphingomonadaceae bacterium]|nr:esterase-like activity of phytase family protein [Sphingomonadaceae bacterium]
MRIARALAAAAALALLAAARPLPETAAGLTARPVPLDPQDPARDRVGRLRYVGGIALASSDRRFGGLSGMRFLPDGRLLAISDSGDWLTLALDEPGGRLTGAHGLSIRHMEGIDGAPLLGKTMSDAEALEIEPDGTRLVAFERRHRVLAYPADGGAPNLVPFPDPAWLASLPVNGGLEAMARVGGLRVFLSEDTGADGVNAVLWPVGRSTGYGRTIYQAPLGYKPTDAIALDDRTMLVLNRRFTISDGMSAVLTRVAVDPMRMTLSKPETVAELVPPVSVDNMEAITLKREGGRVFVYLASDDNFSPLQRTLLLKFELLP